MTKLHGEVLVGFGDFFTGDEAIIGLPTGPTSAPASMPRMPSLATHAPKAPLMAAFQKAHHITVKKPPASATAKASPHKTALANAALASNQAVNVAQFVAKKTAAYKARLAQGQHLPLIKTAALLHPIVRTAVGAKPLTAKQKKAVAFHTQATMKLAAAKKAAAAAAAAAHTAGTKGLSFVQAAVPAMKKALVVKPFSTPTAPTILHGIIGYIDSVGGVEHLSDEEVIGLASVLATNQSPLATPPPLTGSPVDPNNPPDPSQPGLLMDGSPDPNYTGDGTGGATPVDPNNPPNPQNPGYLMDGSVDPNYTGDGTTPTATTPGTPGTGQVLDPDGNVLYDPATDPEVVPMPVRNQPLTQDQMTEVWQNVPADALVYGGQSIYPVNSLGSYNVFFGSPKNKSGWGSGFIFGLHNAWMAPQNQIQHDDVWNQGVNLQSGSSAPTNVPSDAFVDAHFSSGTALGQSSINMGWGPIIGNPNGPLANIQFAMQDQIWFWQSANAPLSYSAEADAKLAAANQTTITTNRAAAVAVAKQMMADRMASNEAMAKQNAANALAESAATSAANVAASAQQAQQGDVETQAEQGLVTQQAADTAQQTSETQTEAQAAQILMQQAQQAPPQGYYDQSQDGGGGDDGSGDGGDQGGGDDSGYDPFASDESLMDDGSNAPGGDMMQDQDGSGYEDDGSDQG